MRYVHTKKGTLLSPRAHLSHRAMLAACGLGKDEVISAGFVAARYAPEEPWCVYGNSVGLGVGSISETALPNKLWAGVTPHQLAQVVFSDNPELLASLQDVTLCRWGMSNEGPGGCCAVYTPLHPRRALHADELLRD